MTTPISIPARFSGPAGVANGGYTCGLLAAVLGDVARVTLTRPTPLETPLRLTAVTSGVILEGPGGIVARAEPGTLRGRPPEPVDPVAAQAATARYRGWYEHPFPTCFVCGPERPAGDGLRLFAGPVGDRAVDARATAVGTGRVACTWVPDPSLAAAGHPTRVAPEYVWAALDCPGGWSSDIESRPLVLGTMTARVDGVAEVGRGYVVVGENRGADGRKTHAATAMYDPAGTLVACAEQVWIEVDPEVFGRLQA